MKINSIHFLSALAIMALSGSAVAQPLPDLTITDLKVNAQCQIEVSIKNLGPGSLPETAFYVGTQPSLDLYRNNQSMGGWLMGRQALKQPGGTYTYVVQANNMVVSGSQNIRAVIDSGNRINEANENNNDLNRTLNCSPALPDLAILNIVFLENCRARIRLKNIGAANYPDNSFNTVNLNRAIDGSSKGYMRLKDIDPNGQLKAAGGQIIWTDLPDFVATDRVKYRLSGRGIGADGNAANNERSASIPATGCGVQIIPQKRLAPEKAIRKLPSKTAPH